MTAHDHREFVEGCYRCDLSRDEMTAYTPTMAELKDYATSYSAIASEAEWDRALAAHDAAKRAGWEAEQGGHVVPCARCGQRKVVASDAINSDMEVCGRCGTEIGLHELAEQPKGRRWYAACWQDDNGVLSRIESWTAAREYAEADVKRWRAIESKEEGGQPDRVILATKIECPWLPVPDTGAES